jgi:hypothetical protein
MTDCHHHDVLTQLSSEHRALRQLIPDVYGGFAAMSDAALVDGASSSKVKEPALARSRHSPSSLKTL